jgi:hypothetical protein
MNARATRRFDRRSLLTGLGLGLGGVPLLRLLERAAIAAPSSALERFVGVYMPHGVAKELWRPQPNFQIGYDDASLQPFDDAATYGKSFRDQLLAIEGLDLTAGIDGGSAGHTGARALFTGAGFDATNASLDQFLAVQQGLGSATPLASLVLGVGHAESDIGACISYAQGGVQLPKIVDPSVTFATALGQWLVGSDPAAQAAAARQRQRGQSVLDALRGDLAALEARAGAAQRAKLEQHADALRALEKQLAGFELACAPPAAPDPASFPKLLAYQGGEPYFDVISNLQVDLLAAAMACGVTRFATLYLADLSYTGLDPELPADVHSDVAHRYVAAADDGSSAGNAESQRLLARQNRYCYSKVARLAQRLDEAGLLASTLIVASSDMGDPARHSSRGIPTVALGGSAAGIGLGRYLDARVNGRGTPNNRLLVSVCRAFGLDVAAFGEDADPAVTNGDLPGFLP